MDTFPSDNEKKITLVIISFVIGAAIGILVSIKIQNFTILFTATTTLAAAFIGAWTAFKLEDNKKKREQEDKCLESANNILFALYERTKALKIFQRDSINPHRDHPYRMIAMLPILDFNFPESEFKVESLLFLLGTKHSQLMLDLHTERECFKEAFKLIRFRSNLHLDHVQPAIESGGIQEGGEYTRKHMLEVIGERVFAQLDRSTEAVIENVDRTIQSSEKIKSRLVAALKELFPNKKILNFEFRDDAA